jgi:hypothetical protein
MKLEIRVMLTAICFAVILGGLSACNDGSDSAASSSSGAAANPSTGAPVSASTGAVAVTPTSISGTPAAAVSVGSAYEFTPIIKAEAAAELSFTISNQPSWASFDASTGKLSGTPTSADVGEYQNIAIVAHDGSSSASLAPFSIDVKTASEVATITWATPLADTATSNVAGYHVYYGSSAGGMTNIVDISNAKETSYVISNLASGTWYFAMTSYDAAQVESARSATVMVTL